MLEAVATEHSLESFAQLAKQARAQFPILHQQVHGYPLVYLDNAASTQKPRAVISAISHYYEHDHANVHRGLHALSTRATDAYEGARDRVARFLGARSSSEIIFTRGTTESINLVAAAYARPNLNPGDAILLTEMEHHSNIVPWQLVARATGAVLRFVPVDPVTGLLDVESVRAALRSDVKIFAFTHVSNTLGTVNPIREFCELARQRGVVTLVDAAQSAGHRPLNVEQIGCDFLAFSSHKACGPTGIGVLFGREEILHDMQPYQGGGEMISVVDWHESSWKSPPYRFEAGTPNIADAVGLTAALDYLDALGRDVIMRYDHALAQYAYEQLSDIPGLRLLGPSSGRASLVSFLLAGVHAHDLVTYLDQFGFALRGGHHCNQPLMRKLGVPSSARASFYFYNEPREVDQLVQAVKEARHYFGEA
jgi:cysteine desulfurase/selenocysteine lyase